MLVKYFTYLFKKLRLSNPWNYKAPVLISVPYFMMCASEMAFESSLLAFGASLLTIFGISGFGYYTNDLADIKKDAAAGKPNALADVSWFLRILLLLFLLSCALLPWVFYFPVKSWTIILLIIEFGLFILYAFPPFRLKERGFFGVLADAGYAHVVPGILAALTFFWLAGSKFEKISLYLIILGTWQFCLGVRNILLHQLQDEENDRNSGTRTIVVKHGAKLGWVLVKYLFVPGELVALLALGWLYSSEMLYFVLVYPVFALIQFVNYKLQGKTFAKDIRNLLYTWLDDFYLEWIPLGVLAGLCLVDLRFLTLAGMHILLFRNGVKTFFKTVLGKLGC